LDEPSPTDASIVQDLQKEVYEQFDDYMEIVIEIGYVTLFASAYPLAALISIVANWVEIRSDCYKLTHVCQRPDPYRSSSLGMWKPLMASLIWMSALTNCLIAGFSSAQLMHYLPNFYVRDEEHKYNIEHEDGWLVVFVIFGLERLLLAIGVTLYFLIPSVPEDVADELERRQYIRQRERADTLAASMRGLSQRSTGFNQPNGKKML
jgi:anoctamin-10